MPATLFTFGCGAFGELGVVGADSSKWHATAPVVFPPSAPQDAVGEPALEGFALGTDHSLALVGGCVFRWGLLGAHAVPRPWRGGAAVGAGTAADPSPEVVPTPTSIAGSGHASSSRARAALPRGQVGQEGGSKEAHREPSFRSVACGGSNSFMLTSDGEAFLLGGLWPPGGDPSQVRHLWGAARGGPPSRVVKIAAGWRHCLLLTESGCIFALGDDEHGQCAGINTGATALPVPTQQPIAGVAAGACHSVAWDRAGKAFSWGHGGTGRLGLGRSDHRRSPMRIDGLNGEIVCSASCGASFTLFATTVDDGEEGASARRLATSLWACGGNRYGQLGIGGNDVACREVPVRLSFPNGADELIGLACGANHVLCLTRPPAKSGSGALFREARPTVWAWGCAASGQCGRVEGEPHGTAPPSMRAAPMALAEFSAPSAYWAVAVAAGRSHSAVLARAGAGASAYVPRGFESPVKVPRAAESPAPVPAAAAGAHSLSPRAPVVGHHGVSPQRAPSSARSPEGRMHGGRSVTSPLSPELTLGRRSPAGAAAQPRRSGRKPQSPAKGPKSLVPAPIDDDIIEDFLFGLGGAPSPRPGAQPSHFAFVAPPRPAGLASSAPQLAGFGGGGGPAKSGRSGSPTAALLVQLGEEALRGDDEELAIDGFDDSAVNHSFARSPPRSNGRISAREGLSARPKMGAGRGMRLPAGSARFGSSSVGARQKRQPPGVGERGSSAGPRNAAATRTPVPAPRTPAMSPNARGPNADAPRLNASFVSDASRPQGHTGSRLNGNANGSGGASGGGGAAERGGTHFGMYTPREPIAGANFEHLNWGSSADRRPVAQPPHAAPAGPGWRPPFAAPREQQQQQRSASPSPSALPSFAAAARAPTGPAPAHDAAPDQWGGLHASLAGLSSLIASIGASPEPARRESPERSLWPTSLQPEIEPSTEATSPVPLQSDPWSAAASDEGRAVGPLDVVTQPMVGEVWGQGGSMASSPMSMSRLVAAAEDSRSVGRQDLASPGGGGEMWIGSRGGSRSSTPTGRSRAAPVGHRSAGSPPRHADASAEGLHLHGGGDGDSDCEPLDFSDSPPEGGAGGGRLGRLDGGGGRATARFGSDRGSRGAPSRSAALPHQWPVEPPLQPHLQHQREAEHVVFPSVADADNVGAVAPRRPLAFPAAHEAPHSRPAQPLSVEAISEGLVASDVGRGPAVAAADAPFSLGGDGEEEVATPARLNVSAAAAGAGGGAGGARAREMLPGGGLRRTPSDSLQPRGGSRSPAGGSRSPTPAGGRSQLGPSSRSPRPTGARSPGLSAASGGLQSPSGPRSPTAAARAAGASRVATSAAEAQTGVVPVLAALVVAVGDEKEVSSAGGGRSQLGPSSRSPRPTGARSPGLFSADSGGLQSPSGPRSPTAAARAAGASRVATSAAEAQTGVVPVLAALVVAVDDEREVSSAGGGPAVSGTQAELSSDAESEDSPRPAVANPVRAPPPPPPQQQQQHEQPRPKSRSSSSSSGSSSSGGSDKLATIAGKSGGIAGPEQVTTSRAPPTLPLQASATPDTPTFAGAGGQTHTSASSSEGDVNDLLDGIDGGGGGGCGGGGTPQAATRSTPTASDLNDLLTTVGGKGAQRRSGSSSAGSSSGSKSPEPRVASTTGQGPGERKSPEPGATSTTMEQGQGVVGVTDAVVGSGSGTESGSEDNDWV
mmetsp:Transcript_156098/g.500668  ORF Transcript_156098/g.500668 Transcript_156098/m.500668 type:complete len:1690 (-) Transcript_156098:67-5136(-)